MSVDVVAIARSVSFVEVVGAWTSLLAVSLQFGGDLQAQVAWEESPNGLATLTLRGALPPQAPGPLRLDLRPQRGVPANLEATLFKEIHVDDAVIDAAFVIHGYDPALLVAALPELRALAADAPTVRVDAKELHVRFGPLAEADAPRAVEGALALWHRAVFFTLAAA